MGDYSFGLGKNKPISAFVDQTLIGTPIPVTTSTVDKKISENPIDGARMMRLGALRSRASWISNMDSPRAAPPKEMPLSDLAKNDHSETSRSSSSKPMTGRKSSESFQSILNLQTMEDLSGSVIDVNIGSERLSSATRTTFRVDVEKENLCEQSEGNKENTLMPYVGISPGKSVQNDEEDEILRTRHDSEDSDSIKDDLTLNWDEITRPPSPPVRDRDRAKSTSNSPRWANDILMPSRLLGRTKATPVLPTSSIEASSSSQRRLESILASDNSELSSFSLSGGSGVRQWVRNIPSSSDAFRSGSSKTSPKKSFSEHLSPGKISNIGSLRSGKSFLLELEKAPEQSCSYSENFEGQRAISSSSWLTQQIKDDSWRAFVAGRENANILSDVGLSSDNTSTFHSLLSPASAAPVDRMASIREEEDPENFAEDNKTRTSPRTKTENDDLASNHEALSVSALHVDSASVAASGQSRGMRGHPLASSTVASLTASMASSDDGSSLVNLSDIRHALDNDLWESHGPSGVASFVESRAKEERRKKKEKLRKPSTTSKDSKESSTIRASSGETMRPSTSPGCRWVPLRESIRGSPPVRRIQEEFVDLASSSLERSAANGFIASLASSQVTALKVSNINRNNNNVNSNCREQSDAEDVVLSCVAQLVFPQEVSFNDVCLRGTQTERTFSLINRFPRTVSCHLEIIYCAVNGEPVTGEVARSIFLVRHSLVLGSGATRVVRVFFKPHRAGTFSAELRIIPDHSPEADVVVNLNARAEAPQLRLLLSDEDEEEEEGTQRRLDFGPMVWSASRVKRLMLMNDSQADLPVVARLEVTSRFALRCFGLRAGEDGPIERQVELIIGRSGGTAELDICCRIPEANSETDQAVIAQATLTVSLQVSTCIPRFSIFQFVSVISNKFKDKDT